MRNPFAFLQSLAIRAAATPQIIDPLTQDLEAAARRVRIVGHYPEGDIELSKEPVLGAHSSDDIEIGRAWMFVAGGKWGNNPVAVMKAERYSNKTTGVYATSLSYFPLDLYFDNVMVYQFPTWTNAYGKQL